MSKFREVNVSNSKWARFHYLALTSCARFLPHRRGLRKLTYVMGLMFGANVVRVKHEEGFAFQFRLSDPYWTPILFENYLYEPEIGQLLKDAKPEVFIDGGANKGYWTAFAKANHIPRVIAVEASACTFNELMANAGGVEAHNAALYCESGKRMRFSRSGSRHDSAHLLDGSAELTVRPGRENVEVVETMRLDDLVCEGRHAVIKLDIEGAEINAIKGARRLINEGALVIYEDHGRDRKCTISDFLLRNGMTIWFNGKNLRSTDDVRKVKTSTARGYNFTTSKVKNEWEGR